MVKNRTAMSVTVAEWISRYQDDAHEAMRELLNFILKVSLPWPCLLPTTAECNPCRGGEQVFDLSSVGRRAVIPSRSARRCTSSRTLATSWPKLWRTRSTKRYALALAVIAGSHCARTHPCASRLCAQEGGQYPIIGRGKMRKFKSNFLEFWDKLINKTQYTIIYDEAFLGNLVTIALVVSRFVSGLHGTGPV